MKILRWLDKYFEEVIMMAFLLIIVFSMGLQVIMRYVVGYSLSFPEEISRYSFIWLSFLGISYAVKVDASLKVDILHLLVPKLKDPLNVLGDVVYFIFCIVLIKPGIQSVQAVMRLGSSSAALSIPMWMIYSSLLVGVVLAVIRLIQKYVLKWMQYRRNGNDDRPEVAASENQEV